MTRTIRTLAGLFLLGGSLVLGLGENASAQGMYGPYPQPAGYVPGQAPIGGDPYSLPPGYRPAIYNPAPIAPVGPSGPYYPSHHCTGANCPQCQRGVYPPNGGGFPNDPRWTNWQQPVPYPTWGTTPSAWGGAMYTRPSVSIRTPIPGVRLNVDLGPRWVR